MTRLIDFDAFRAEQKQEALELRIGGEVYQLPSTLPVAVAIDTIRLKKANSDEIEVPPEELDKLGKGVFGEEVWEDLKTKHSLGIEETGELFKRVLAMYSGTPADPQMASTQETPTPSSL